MPQLPDLRGRIVIDTSSAQESASKVGGLFEKGMGAVKGAALGAGAAVAAVAGVALVKGFQRLDAIDQATAKLTGLGHSADEVKGIMSNATAAVKGTAFGLGEAASQAATAVAAGVKPGADLTRTLSLMADTATIAGADMGEIGPIFNKIAASGKLTGESLAQLQDRGIPAIQFLSESLHKTPEEVQKLVSAGKVGFPEFQDAMEKGLGGAAQASGQTFQGAMANVQASLGRLGAGVLGPLFTSLAPLLNSLIPVFDSLGGVAAQLGTQLSAVFAPLIPVLGPVIEMLGKALLSALTTVMPAFIQLANAIMPLVPVLAQLAGTILGVLADVLVQILNALTPLIPPLVMFIAQLVGALAPYLPQIGQALGALAGAVGQILQAFLPLLPVILQIVTAFLPLIPLVAQLATLIAQLVVALMPVIQWIIQLAAVLVGVLTQALAGIIKMVVDFVSQFLSWISQLVTAAPAAIGGMVNAISGWFAQLPGRVSGAVNSMVSSVTGAFSSLWGSITSGVSSGIGSVVSLFSGLGGKITGAISGIVSDAYSAGGRIISSLADGVRNAGATVVKAAQDVVQKVRDLLPFSPAKTGPLSGMGYPLYSGMAISESLAQGITRSGGLAVRAMNSVMGGLNTTGAGSFAFAGQGANGVPGVGGSPIEVRVFIGDRELTDIVRVEVGGANARTATALVGGSV
jgi:tape measure domain-containing protein